MKPLRLTRWHLIALFVAGSVAVVAAQTQIVSILKFRTTNCVVRSGSADPEGSVTAPACAIYLRTNGIVYKKGSGTGNTGWIALAGGSGVGDVTAASTFGTDNRLIRSDGTGKGVQASGVTLNDSDQITGLKVDCEGSGNDCGIPSERYYPIVGCQAGTASLLFSYKVNPPTGGCEGSTVPNGFATFPDAAGEYEIVLPLPLPSDWTGTMDVAGWARTTGSGNLVVQVTWACTAAAAAATDSWQTAVNTGAVAVGSSGQYFAWSKTGISVTTGAAGRGCKLRIFRDRAHASDSLNATFDMTEHIAVVLRRTM